MSPRAIFLLRLKRALSKEVHEISETTGKKKSNRNSPLKTSPTSDFAFPESAFGFCKVFGKTESTRPLVRNR